MSTSIFNNSTRYSLIILLAFTVGMTLKLHSPLARVLYEKFQHVQEHIESKHEYWYIVREEYISADLLVSFMQMEQDDETTKFLQSCFNKSDWFFTQLYHAISKSILSWFMSVTSVNGLLNRGTMFVFSTAQFRKLLGVREDWRGQRLLDLGAGDGNVTAKMSPLFDEVFVTELSTVMQWRLQKANYTVLGIDDWQRSRSLSVESPTEYDVISCLNLLDRCSAPLTLLKQIREVLRSGSGLLVVALVFPLKQFVEYESTNKPAEILNVSKITNGIWEEQFSHFVTNILQPAGFELVRWSRLPYLCEGDFSSSFYFLNDIVMVLRAL